jgi:hypothetical protein
VQSKTASGLVEVYVVLDAGLMYRSQHTIMREEAVSEEVVVASSAAQEDRLKCYSEYRVKGEFLYARPFLEEYLRSLLQRDRVKVKLCMNIDRPRLIGFAMHLFGNKKLKDLKKRVSALLDERYFAKQTSTSSPLSVQDLTSLDLT